MFIFLRIILFIAPLLALLIAYTVPWNATFSINATTNIVTLDTSDQTPPRWWVENATLFDSESEQLFSGQIAIQSDVSVIIRKDRTEVLQVELQGSADDSVVAKLYDGQDSLIKNYSGTLYLEIPTTAASQNFPVVGNITAGQLVSAQTFGSNSILVDGSVSVLGKSLLSEGRFAAGEAFLQSGDELKVIPGRFDKIAVGYGLVTIDSASSYMQLTYHAYGEKVQVSRYGSEGYMIKPSIPSRITSDPVLQTLAILYAALWPLVGFRARFQSKD